MKLYEPHGDMPEAGDICRNPDLARTLASSSKPRSRRVQRAGTRRLKAARDRFYKGDIAHEMAAFSEANGGLFRYEDFANYTAKSRPRSRSTIVAIRSTRILRPPRGRLNWSRSTCLEGYDLKEMGHNTADYIHTSAEAVKLAMADREKYLGDMDFIKIPYAGLLSKDYARERRKLIDPAKASLELRPGPPEKFSRQGALDRPVHEFSRRRATTATPATSPSSTRIATWSASSPASTADFGTRS